MPSQDLTVFADALWGENRLAYHVQARLSDETRDALSAIQRQLHNLAPIALHLIAASSLHVSIYALVPVRLPDPGKEQHWQQIAERATADLRRLCSASNRLRLCFQQVRVTPNAIIAVAGDASGLIAKLRAHFAGTPAYHFGPPQTFDLIHCTLARYRENGVLPFECVASFEGLPLVLNSEIAGISIVRERVYPCLAVDELMSVALD